MSDLGLLSLKLNQTSIHLRQVNNAIDLLRKSSEKNHEKREESTKELLKVLTPIKQLLQGKFSRAPTINEQSIVQILQQKHNKNWNDFRGQVTSVTDKLEKLELDLSDQNIDCLDDVADAIDAECSRLFRRINGRL